MGLGCNWSLICFLGLCLCFAVCYLGSTKLPSYTARSLVWHGNASTRPGLAELRAYDLLEPRGIDCCCSLPALSPSVALQRSGPESTAKLAFFMLLPCWSHVRSLPCQPIKALRTWLQPGEKRPLLFPPLCQGCRKPDTPDLGSLPALPSGWQRVLLQEYIFQLLFH